MRLVQADGTSWVVQYEGKNLSIGGVTFFDDRESALAEISKRGLTVDDDGAIHRLPVHSAEPAEPAGPAETPAATPETEKPRRPRGRPRTFTKEEALERRREQNRRYYAARAERRREEVAERARQWWADHPEKVREYRNSANAKRRERYQNDPEYKAKVDAANRAYQERKRAERAALKDADKA